MDSWKVEKFEVGQAVVLILGIMPKVPGNESVVASRRELLLLNH